MIDLERKLNILIAKIKNYFIGIEKIESTTTLKKKQRLNFILLITLGFVSFFVLILFL